MALAKAVISGIVYRAPEKRFTSNNVPITAFTMNVGENEETLVRAIALGNLADTVANSVQKGERVIVEGRLQTASVKQDDGTEKKIMEISLSSFEKLSGGASASQKNNSEAVKFSTEDFSEDLIGEDEIPF